MDSYKICANGSLCKIGFSIWKASLSGVLLIISQAVEYLNNQLYSSQQSARAAVEMYSSVVSIVRLCLFTLLAMALYSSRWVQFITYGSDPNKKCLPTINSRKDYVRDIPYWWQLEEVGHVWVSEVEEQHIYWQQLQFIMNMDWSYIFLIWRTLFLFQKGMCWNKT